MSLPSDTTKLRNLIAEALRVAVLIIDPITAYLAGSVEGRRHHQAVRGLLDQVDSHRLFVGLHHHPDQALPEEQGGQPPGLGRRVRPGRTSRASSWLLGSTRTTPSSEILAIPKNSLMRDVQSHRYEIEDCNGVGRWRGGQTCDLTARILASAT